MRSRQFAFAAATIAVIAALAGGVSPAQAKTPACQKGSTLAISKSARVFSVKKNGIRRVYGCASGQKKRSLLGRRDGKFPRVDVSQIAVNGPRVAYVRTSCGQTICQQRVIVRDLKKRKELSDSQAVADELGGSENETKVLDIVLATKGLVAWISEVGDPAFNRHVFARVPGGQPVLLDTGLINDDSLALAGTRLYWTVNEVVPQVFDLSTLL